MQAEHAVDHGHEISSLQHGLGCIMPRYIRIDRVETYT